MSFEFVFLNVWSWRLGSRWSTWTRGISWKYWRLLDFENKLDVCFLFMNTSVFLDDLNIPQAAYPYIENVVASCETGAEIDLKNVALRVRNAEYNPRKVISLDSNLIYSLSFRNFITFSVMDSSFSTFWWSQTCNWKIAHPRAPAPPRGRGSWTRKHIGGPRTLLISSNLVDITQLHQKVFQPNIFVGCLFFHYLIFFQVNAVVVRFMKPKATVMIYQSGKVN